MKGYRYSGRLFPFKKSGKKKVTLYSIYCNKTTAQEESKKFLDFSEKIELIETNIISKEMFLHQYSSTGLMEGCAAKLPHICQNGEWRIHLWFDPANQGVGFFCETAILKMAENYPFNSLKKHKEELISSIGHFIGNNDLSSLNRMTIADLEIMKSNLETIMKNYKKDFEAYQTLRKNLITLSETERVSVITF